MLGLSAERVAAPEGVDIQTGSLKLFRRGVALDLDAARLALLVVLDDVPQVRGQLVAEQLVRDAAGVGLVVDGEDVPRDRVDHRLVNVIRQLGPVVAEPVRSDEEQVLGAGRERIQHDALVPSERSLERGRPVLALPLALGLGVLGRQVADVLQRLGDVEQAVLVGDGPLAAAVELGVRLLD